MELYSNINDRGPLNSLGGSVNCDSTCHLSQHRVCLNQVQLAAQSLHYQEIGINAVVMSLQGGGGQQLRSCTINTNFPTVLSSVACQCFFNINQYFFSCLRSMSLGVYSNPYHQSKHVVVQKSVKIKCISSSNNQNTFVILYYNIIVC